MLVGCVAAPPPPLAPPRAEAPPPGAQDPTLARDAALDGLAIAVPDASRVSQHQIALPTGSVQVTNLSLPDAVFFDFGSAQPRPDAAPALDALARAIRASPADSVLTVSGNTDSVGTQRANQELSEARARSVVEALARNGIDPSRLAAIGFGASRPIAPNSTQEGRALNRRVELALSPSFAANAASFTTLVPVSVAPVSVPVSMARVSAPPPHARQPAPLDVRPNRPDAIEPNSLGPPVSY